MRASYTSSGTDSSHAMGTNGAADVSHIVQVQGGRMPRVDTTNSQTGQMDEDVKACGHFPSGRSHDKHAAGQQ